MNNKNNLRIGERFEDREGYFGFFFLKHSYLEKTIFFFLFLDFAYAVIIYFICLMKYFLWSSTWPHSTSKNQKQIND